MTAASDERPLADFELSDADLVMLAFRWGGVTPAQLEECTLAQLHAMWELCDARDKAEREQARK